MSANAGVREQVGFIEPIEGLRGVAVLLVILFHYAVILDARFADPWLAAIDGSLVTRVIVRNGMIGVDLFFLITGFLLVLPWLREAAGQGPAPSALDFYRRRSQRILPAYYVQLLVLFFVFVPLLRGFEFWYRNLVYMFQNLSSHIFLVHYFSPGTSASLSLNGSLWSLALEAQFYLLLPLLAPVFARAPWRIAVALLACAIAWRWAAHSHMDGWVAALRAIEPQWNVPEAAARQLLYTQLPGYLGHFAAGMLAARAWLQWRARPPGPRDRCRVARHRDRGLPRPVGVAFARRLDPRRGHLGVGAGRARGDLPGVGRARSAVGARPALQSAARVRRPRELLRLPLPSPAAVPVEPQRTGADRLVARAAALPRRGVLDLVALVPLRRAARARADEHRGADREHLQRRHAPEDLGETPRVHEHAERDRGDGEPGVDPRVDEAVDPAEGGLPESARGRAAHEHVARRAGEPHAESHQGHERGERPPRHPTRSDQQRAQRAETERSGNELLLALALGGEEPARGDAAGAAEQVGSQRSGGRGERHSVGALEDRRSEVLQPTEGHHGEHEEEEAHPHDARAQEREGAALLRRVLGGQGSDLEPACG
jgi:peptidoglycan/LPS O-acetylase OafA/YrhL